MKWGEEMQHLLHVHEQMMIYFFILLFIRSRLMRNLRVEARVAPVKGLLSTLSFLDGLIMFVSTRMKLFALRSSRYNFFSLSLPSPPVQIYHFQ